LRTLLVLYVNEERALTYENLWHSFPPLSLLAGEDLGPVRVFWPDGSFEPPYESCFPGITFVCYYCCLLFLFILMAPSSLPMSLASRYYIYVV
jgi:hypothetical protein